jgi:hypothetical protein
MVCAMAVRALAWRQRAVSPARKTPALREP